MPKSQKRLDVEAKFRALALKHGGKVLFEMDQMDFKSFWEQAAGGKCNGICVLWLRHQHNEVQSKAFEQLLTVRYREMEQRAEEAWARAEQFLAADERARRELFTEGERKRFKDLGAVFTEPAQKKEVQQSDMFAQVLHGKMHREGQINPFGNRQEEVTRVRAIMLEYGMKYDSEGVYAGGWGHGHSDLGKFVSESGTASILHSSQHAMAACNTLGKPQFFDPNLGAIEFKNGGKLGSFLSDFFKIPLINSVYGGHEEYKKLNVVAFRYTYAKDRVFTIRDPVKLTA